MKAKSLDLRQRVVAFVKEGGGKVEAAKLFKIGRRSVYRYMQADEKNCLEPKKSWGSWRRLDPEKLAAYVQKHPNATLKDMQEAFKVSHQAIWVRLGQLGITLKKSHLVSGTRRGAAMALQEGTRKAGRKADLLPRRVRNRPRFIS